MGGLRCTTTQRKLLRHRSGFGWRASTTLWRASRCPAEAHALFHAIVENQVAEGVEPTCRTMERLRREGLTRHDAVHAVGSVIAQFVYDSMRGDGGGSTGDALRELNAKIESLSAREWRSGM